MPIVYIHNPLSLLPPYKFYTFQTESTKNLKEIIIAQFPILKNVPLKFYHIHDVSKLKYTWNYNKYCPDSNLSKITAQSQNILVNYNHSQHNEDSILHRIFKKIGLTNKFFVDIGCRELEFTSNVYILRQNNWSGFGCDPNTNTKTLSNNTLIVKTFATPKNFEALLRKYEVPRRFDFLSIDIDGDDYYLLEALKTFKPRVICIELDADVSHKNYVAPMGKASRNRSSCSIIKMNELCESKGYKLIYNNGGNGFFVLKEYYKLFKPINQKKYANKVLKELHDDMFAYFPYQHDKGLLRKMYQKFKKYQDPKYNDWYIPTVDITSNV